MICVSRNENIFVPADFFILYLSGFDAPGKRRRAAKAEQRSDVFHIKKEHTLIV